MKVMAVNSSPRVGHGSKTEIMLEALIEGMREAGAEVELINLKDKKIRPCQGCFTCWTKTPGKCIHQDDMSQEILPQLYETDMVIYASPLYIHGFTAAMQNFMERTLPMAEPYLVRKEDGTWSHPARREGVKAVVLSVCGFPGMNAFDALVFFVNHHFKKVAGTLAGEIYRPGAESLSMFPELLEEVLAATRQAGRELIQTNQIAPETKARIEQPITEDIDSVMEMAKCYWNTCLKHGVSPKEFAEQDLLPEPETIREFMALLQFGFNPKNAGDMSAVFQFDFTGPAEGTCQAAIQNGAIQVTDGPAKPPDVTVQAPFDLWASIMTGKTDGAQAFMEGLYKVEGDAGLLMKMGEIFGRKNQDAA